MKGVPEVLDQNRSEFADVFDEQRYAEEIVKMIREVQPSGWGKII